MSWERTMNKTTRQILGTAAIAGMVMAGGAAAAQADDGGVVDPVTGAIIDDNGVHGPGHVDLNDAPDDGDTAVAPAVDPAAVPAADPAAEPAAEPALTADEAEDAKDAEEEAEEAAEDAEEAAEDAEDETQVEDDGIPHAEGLDDAPGAPDDGL
jgi:hypothetical protein